MNLINNFKLALKYANYDLYKIKSEIAELIIHGRKEGLGNPDYCKITIKNSSIKQDYPVLIDLYYKSGEEEVIRLPKQIIIGKFSSIKTQLLTKLETNGYVEIVIKNLAELLISEKEEVCKPIIFSSIVNFKPQAEYLSREINIKDELFTYRVTYTYTTISSDSKSVSKVYSNILNIPTDVLAKLESDSVVTLKLN